MKERIKILHIVQGMNIGGIETMLMNIYRNINRDLVQFDFLLSCKEKSDYEDEIISLGGEIFRMSPIKILSPAKYLNDINDFFKEHQEYKIVHSHMNAVSALPLYIAKKNNVPVRICHSHTNRARGFKGILKWILKYPLKSLANNYFACSADAANFLYGKWFFSNPNCHILNNAIDAKLYVYDPSTQSQIRKQFDISDKIVIGHVGRFNAVKNHIFILDVFKLIHDKNTNTVLMLVGDGELRIQIEEKILTLGLTESVIMTGVVPNVFDYLQAMDVYIFPSLFEGLGMSLIEAQAAGIMCFAADSVPTESAVTDLVEYIPLTKGANFWANKILNANCKKGKEDKFLYIQKAGYDIKSSSDWLEKYYLDIVK